MSLAEATPADLTRKSESNPEVVAFLIAAVLLTLWGLSVALFGLPGLYIPAVAAVPVVYTLLMIITRG